MFQALNPVFLSSSNLVNMLFDCSTVGVISLGIVCILMVGEIDLSVGSVSGFASALVGVFWVNQGWPVVLAVLTAMIVGALIGSLYAFVFNRFGMPSFVSTLSGLLAVLGLQLYILGATGSINLPYGSWLVSFGQIMVMPDPVAYLLVALAGIAFFFASYRTSRAGGRPACRRNRPAGCFCAPSSSHSPWKLSHSISTSRAAFRGCSAFSSGSPPP